MLVKYFFYLRQVVTFIEWVKVAFNNVTMLMIHVKKVSEESLSYFVIKKENKEFFLFDSKDLFTIVDKCNVTWAGRNKVEKNLDMQQNL